MLMFLILSLFLYVMEKKYMGSVISDVYYYIVKWQINETLHVSISRFPTEYVAIVVFISCMYDKWIGLAMLSFCLWNVYAKGD
jgi:hypothetical protein